MHIRTRTGSTIINIEKGIGHNWGTVFDCHWNNGVISRDGKFSLCSGIRLFFENYRKGLLGAGSVALSKHNTHYGPRPDFPFYNLATHHCSSDI